MRKIALLFLGFFICMGIQAQDKDTTIAVGDVMVIDEPSGSDFRYIHFPKKNFIIKRGAIADMKSVHQIKVVVSNIEKGADGSTKVTLRRKDGGKFFRFFPSVDANLEKALSEGELMVYGTK